MERAEERLLIQRAQQGDKDAFSQLYRANIQAVFRYVYQRVSDVHLAEDITGDVFTRAIESLPRYQDRGQAWLAWLYRIAHARVIDHYRRRDRRPIDSDLEMAIIASPEIMDDNLVKNTIGDALKIAMASLTDEQQEVISLRFIEGLRTDEVAQIMQKKPNAIKALQHRALRAMASRLERAGFDVDNILSGLS